MAGFADSIESFVQATLSDITKVKRASIFDLGAAIILQTPVDKGVLRNNWFISVGTTTDRITHNAAPVGTATINRVKADLETVDHIETVYFVNNLPYAAPIEWDGHSAKAPNGMVRVNTARWEQIVELNVQRFK